MTWDRHVGRGRGPCQIYRRVTLPSSSISPATKTRSERKPVLGIHPLTYRTIHIQLLFGRSLNPQTYILRKLLLGSKHLLTRYLEGFGCVGELESISGTFLGVAFCSNLIITTRTLTCVVWGFQAKPSFATVTGGHTQGIVYTCNPKAKQFVK